MIGLGVLGDRLLLMRTGVDLLCVCVCVWRGRARCRVCLGVWVCGAREVVVVGHAKNRAENRMTAAASMGDGGKDKESGKCYY